MTETYTIERANQFIEQAKLNVNPQYRPQAHFVAPVGWLNDPNGFVYFRGEYHLFYQYYPYDAIWGPMHWGHAKSKDLVHWEHLPVALAPDQPFDKGGCFSGSAIVKDDTLWLMYTGVIVREDGSVRQVQNMAYSTDGIHFEKLATNPVLAEEHLPSEIIPADFRDPKVFEKDGRYYAVIAARHTDGIGCIVLVSSPDLVDWQFDSIFLKGTPEHGEMWECPDYFVLDGQDCLVLSPMRVPRQDLSHHNINTTYFVKGKVDWEQKRFIAESCEEIDHGHDFYAPQTLVDNQNRRLMIAWMNTWGRRNVTKELNHHWAFSMSSVRELSLREGRLLQQPIVQIGTEDSTDSAFIATVELEEVQDISLHWGNAEDFVEVRYDAKEHAVFVNRQFLKIETLGEEKIAVIERGVRVKESALSKLIILIDTNSIEVFVNDGSAVLSSNIYFDAATQPRLTIDKGGVKLTVRNII